MECIEIFGGQPLNGSVKVQGAKNTVLPIMAAAILNHGSSVLHNCPKIMDVYYMVQILEHIGCVTKWEEDTLIIDATTLNSCYIPAQFANKMRSSIFLLGSLLGRFNEAKLPYPGGCVIGERPIGLHLEGLKKLNVVTTEEETELTARVRKLTGGVVNFTFPSVGATENIILAAVCSQGTTRITGAAREPEIIELCRFLNEMGANIAGAGTNEIIVEGVDELHDVEFTIAADRIVAGTYILSALSSGGRVNLVDAPISHISSLLDIITKMGAVYSETKEGLYIDATGKLAAIPFVSTEPYPGFPTDLQSQLMAVLAGIPGESCICENLFEARFKVAKGLNSMGAQITYNDRIAKISGVSKLHGTTVYAEELRGGAALVVAAVGAEGLTLIENRHFIDRGYEDICRDLTYLGANITSKVSG